MLSTETFRMGGHATHDEKEARRLLPPEMFLKWGARDPIGMYEEYLKENGSRAGQLEAIETEVADEIASAEAEALESRASNMPEPESAVIGVYAD